MLLRSLTVLVLVGCGVTSSPPKFAYGYSYRGIPDCLTDDAYDLSVVNIDVVANSDLSSMGSFSYAVELHNPITGGVALEYIYEKYLLEVSSLCYDGSDLAYMKE